MFNIPIIIIKGRTYSKDKGRIQAKGKSRPLTTDEIKHYLEHPEEMTDDEILIDIHDEPYLVNELLERKVIFNGRKY